ncbi:hypothetical protein OAT84_02975 [Gammaproteobacteria bacterium]|nr:hypothetical protein [Gammaproteobacteria bacterium]
MCIQKLAVGHTVIKYNNQAFYLNIYIKQGQSFYLKIIKLNQKSDTIFETVLKDLRIKVEQNVLDHLTLQAPQEISKQVDLELNQLALKHLRGVRLSMIIKFITYEKLFNNPQSKLKHILQIIICTSLLVTIVFPVIQITRYNSKAYQ